MEYTKERAMEWLNKHWQSPKSCPICQNNNWGISDSVVEAREFRLDGGFVLGGPFYPLFLVTCGTCGHTLVFNALVAGFTFERTTSEEKKKETQ